MNGLWSKGKAVRGMESYSSIETVIMAPDIDVKKIRLSLKMEWFLTEPLLAYQGLCSIK